MDWINKTASIYGTNEPLLFEEIQSVLSRYSQQRIYQLIDKAISEQKLIRFENGIYYIPAITIYGISKINPGKVIYRKYIANKGKTYGYYSGLTLLNSLGLTTQVPNIIEVVTNKEASRVREIYVGKQKVRLRKARIPITKENAVALSVLELFNKLDPKLYNKPDWRGVINYIKESKLDLKKILIFSSAYPARAVKNLMNSEVAFEVA